MLAQQASAKVSLYGYTVGFTFVTLLLVLSIYALAEDSYRTCKVDFEPYVVGLVFIFTSDLIHQAAMIYINLQHVYRRRNLSYSYNLIKWTTILFYVNCGVFLIWGIYGQVLYFSKDNDCPRHAKYLNDVAAVSIIAYYILIFLSIGVFFLKRYLAASEKD